MNYFPYDGQNGIRSYKSNGKDDEFEYYFLIICSYLIRFRFMVFNATFNNISAISWALFELYKILDDNFMANNKIHKLLQHLNFDRDYIGQTICYFHGTLHA